MSQRTRYLSYLATGLLLCTLCVNPATAQANSPIREQDREVFDGLYGEKLNDADRTRSFEDDQALIDEMLDFAEGLTGRDLGVKCLIYAEVMTLASSAADIGRMSEAWGLLEATWPTQDLVSLETLVQKASQAYRGVDRSERDTQGEIYVALLRDVTDRYEAQGDIAQAISVSQLASTVARQIGSDQLASLIQTLRRLSAASDLAERVAMLRQSLDKNPQNTTAARELVALLVTHEDDLQAAEQIAALTGDPEIVDLVQRAGRGIEQANAATAMRVADWYIALAEDTPDERAYALLNRSRSWYERFFSLYERDDALAKRAAARDNLALLKIERLLADNPRLAGRPVDGWLPLLAPPFDAKAQQRGQAQRFEVQAGQLRADGAAIFIPFKKADRYEVRIRLTVDEALDNDPAAIFIHLPVGDDRVILTRYHASGRRLASVDRIDENRLLRNLPDRTGQEVVLTFQVAELNGQVVFTMLHQDEIALKWQGELDELDTYDVVREEAARINTSGVIYLEFLQLLTLHAVDYKATE